MQVHLAAAAVVAADGKKIGGDYDCRKSDSVTCGHVGADRNSACSLGKSLVAFVDSVCGV